LSVPFLSLKPLQRRIKILLQADVVGLEITCAAYLSQDPVLMQELKDGVDIHTENQKAFGLPSRLIAKVLKFRIIYGGSAYAFSVDPDFREVGYNEKQWQEIIEAYYRKYKGLAEWHKQIIREVIETRKLVVPSTGREFNFEPINGKWPEPSIKNYPVQSCGADIVALARVSLHNRLKRLREQEERWKQCLLVGTVHDSLVLDYNDKVCHTMEVANLIEGVFKDLPSNFEKMFKVPFTLDVRVEQECGLDWGNMQPAVIEKEK
jgi:DNA polymerase I-like protein with 3'-5' exonuclease and polymerase domains